MQSTLNHFCSSIPTIVSISLRELYFVVAIPWPLTTEQSNASSPQLHSDPCAYYYNDYHALGVHKELLLPCIKNNTTYIV